MLARITAVGVSVLLLAVSYSVADGLFSEEAGGCDGVQGVEGGGGFDFWFSGEVVLPSGVEGVAPRVRSIDVHAVSGVVPSRSVSGSGDFVFELELRDSSGGAVGSRLFVADPVASVHHRRLFGQLGDLIVSDGGVQLGVQDVRSFGFSFSDAPVFGSFAVLWWGQELAVVEQSAHAPIVELSGVSGGQLVGSDEKVRLCLAAGDADGDDLAYRVYYSTDDGASYELHQQLTDAANSGAGVSGLVLDASGIAGSDTARVGVSVSDGARSAFVQTPVFTVKQHPPTISIIAPSATMLRGWGLGSGVEIRVRDAEDEYLPHNEDGVSLHSSIDGPLRVRTTTRVGSYFPRDNLSPGRHIITAMATDSSGRTTTAKATVNVASENTSPEAVDDTVHIPLFTPVLIGVLNNDIDLDGDFSVDSFNVTTPPKLGKAKRLRDSAVSHSLVYVRYVGHTSGVDHLTYQICDTNSICDTAIVQIHVGIGDCTILGTEDDDQLEGTSGDDIICGLGGNDTINGASGDDIIRGGTGDDTLTGGVGDDYIRGGAGDDTMHGNAGRDILFGGSDEDVIFGGGGYDIIGGGDEVGEQQPADELYYGNAQTPISFDELTDTETETIDKAITECRQAISEPYFESRDTRSQCTNILTNLCRTATSQEDYSQLETDRARNAALEFICSTAQLAKLGEQSYLTLDSETDLTVTDQRARSDTFRFIESQILKLYNILVENANGISETTTAKLRELTQTINRFATKAFERPPPIYE